MTVDTFTATIYVGSRVGRTGDPTSRVHDIREIEDVCQRYCDEIGLCVTVTSTTFIYTKGREHGAAVGLINYPRFPSTPEAIEGHAMRLAELLRARMEQCRVTVVMPHKTVMLEDPSPEKPEATHG